MNFKEVSLGIQLESEDHLIIFGNNNCDFKNIQSHYSQFKFSRIRQTHGNSIVHSCFEEIEASRLIEADAHWTRQEHLGLCISTADCMPIFIFDIHSNMIFGIHAGWRGLAEKIVPLSIATFLSHGSKIMDLRLYLGPHIQKFSFEIDQPCLEHLLASTSYSGDRTHLYSELNEKFNFDLRKLLLMQLKEIGMSESQILTFEIDTKSNKKFHSYRRDRDKSGRQISFILRKNKCAI